MKEPMQKYFKIGIVHFMAYPFAMTGEGDIETSVRSILEDPYFDYIELTQIKDPIVRGRVADLAKQGGVGLAYGAQPQLMRNQENLNSLDEALRLQGVQRMKTCVDEAYELGAEGIAFLAGKYDARNIEKYYQALVRSTKEICAYSAAKGNLHINLEIFDKDVEKKSLIGPVDLAVRFAEEIYPEYPQFGL
ncbi:MAG: sugar phosphate isomerase/epimerase, partial [Clostridiales bacterium]|nr:sugar phosphate isomerase/epimerase [Clostridiales bacterium]